MSARGRQGVENGLRERYRVRLCTCIALTLRSGIVLPREALYRVRLSTCIALTQRSRFVPPREALYLRVNGGSSPRPWTLTICQSVDSVVLREIPTA